MKNNFWMFSDEQKSMFVAQTSERVGLPPQAVEKDWWVTMTLKALFESSCRDFITFKGGTLACHRTLLGGYRYCYRQVLLGNCRGQQVAARSDSETFAGLYRAAARCGNAGIAGRIWGFRF